MISSEATVEATVSPAEQPGTNSAQKPVLDLVRGFCEALNRQQIAYCHWKSNEAIDRSASGDNDLDLLIGREDTARFNEILFQMGFVEAFCPEDSEVPGILSYFGLDRATGRIVHVHAHYNLVLGNDFSKNYHLPVEKAYLDTASQQGLFKIPAPEMELIVFVVRMMLKHSTWDTVFSGSFQLSPSEQRELAYLIERADPVRTKALLAQHLPFFEPALFDDCLRAIQPGCPMGQRLRAGERLQKTLRAHARRDQWIDILLKAQRRVFQGLRRRIVRRVPKYRLAAGGAMIAIVGGDGAGKTTAIQSLYKWLGRHFEITQVHMGKPKWSFTTKLVRAVLKLGTLLRLYPYNEGSLEYSKDGTKLKFSAYPALIRQVLTSRDRWLSYSRARRYATNGGLVICDRFPMPQVIKMDGPQAERMAGSVKRNRFVQALVDLEKCYYQQMMLPEILIVLRLDPETAVKRKTDETPESVFARSSEVYHADWEKVSACVVDSSRPKEEVLSTLKSILWSRL